MNLPAPPSPKPGPSLGLAIGLMVFGALLGIVAVVLVTLGAHGSIDTTKINEPIVGFVIGQAGLMYNLTLEGTKISRIQR